MPFGAPGWRVPIMVGMLPGGGPLGGGPVIIRPGMDWPGPTIGPGGVEDEVCQPHDICQISPISQISN